MYSLGKESTRQNRTVMVMGATGAGKSTLINGIVNYIAGVERKDNFRLKLVHEDPSKSQAESQTSEVSVYKLYYQEGFRVPYSLTLVDTPDSETPEESSEMRRSQSRSESSSAPPKASVSSTRSASSPRPHWLGSRTLRNGKQPPVLEAINKANVPCPKNELGLPVHYKFNNSVLFSDNREAESEDSDDDFDEMFWRMGLKSMERFLTDLNKMETKSLQMTKEVLKERKQLEAAVEGLQPQVKAGLAKIEEIKPRWRRSKITKQT
ncbi:hypothetical protein WMY93_001618 [Mugilogobius chulae]|uniref:G domain-containing protein n=1 Tax=Mugilogobius chulae TaxID=88201 RepID=A0AAW0Q253_9GOBI